MEAITFPLKCAECGRVADGRARGWRAYVVWADEGPDDELVILCPECCEREQLG